ncbi:MAG: F0F1 ATP synthase subunit A [Chloroflexi bacterium]|nr:F0F1 ATP synthase subunit A [Chloroflexota bacterium]
MLSPKKLLVLLVVLALFVGGRLFFPIERPPHVQLPAEPIATSPFLITNTMTAAWATILVLGLLFFFATRNMKVVPGRLQAFVEMVIETLVGLCEAAAGKEKGRMFFPLAVTFFLFIIISNWMGLLPGYGTIGLWHEVKLDHEVEQVLYPFFRSANTDLNTTLALALISVVATQFYGIKSVGFGNYVGRFINLKGGIDFFVGILEGVSEVAKIISFSFRLFGNIFAGEVLLGVMAFLIPWIVSIPFLGLELFVGLIQAFIFMMLTLVFLTVATAEHGGEHEAEHGGSH